MSFPIQNFARHVLAWLALLIAQPLAAITPESGWWWNASESGRGYAIEIQDNTLFMAGFLYDQSGAPFWFSSAGRFNSSTDTFEGDMTTFRDGQCFTCPVRRPTLLPVIGRISLRFTSPSEATLTWPFGSIAITRQIYGLSSGISQLLGTHSFSTAGTSGRVHFGNWITFTRTTPDATLGTIANGTTEGGRIVVATLTSDGRSILVLVDASTNINEIYLFPKTFFGTRSGLGLWASYFKSASPPTPTGLAASHRILSSADIGAATQTDLSPSPSDSGPSDSGQSDSGKSAASGTRELLLAQDIQARTSEKTKQGATAWSAEDQLRLQALARAIQNQRRP